MASFRRMALDCPHRRLAREKGRGYFRARRTEGPSGSDPRQAPGCGTWHAVGTAGSRPRNRPGEGTTRRRGRARRSDWTRGVVCGVLTLFCILLSFQKINRTPSDEECFFDLLSKFQSNRMDDQRCPLEECPSEAAEAAATPVPALEERICKHRSVYKSLLLWERCCAHGVASCCGFTVNLVMFSPSLSPLNLAVLWQSLSLFKEGRNILMLMVAEVKAGECELRLRD